MEDLEPAVPRFPLVARPRPPCLPLAERIESQLTEPAQAALEESDPTRALALAASVQNQAALLASDCGLPGLASQLCWQQFDAFRAGWPLTASAARHCLEPLVNLARLQIRSGNGQGAHCILESLYRAVTIGEEATIDGRRLTFDRLVDTGDDHRAVSQWLWTVVLADGIRALASEGRWQDAAAHADRHGGIGRRLLDGRQAAILAYWADDDPASATALLKATEPAEHWEHAVASCLVVLCTVDAPAQARAVQVMTACYLNLASEPLLRPFRVRLGLATLGLASQAGKAHRDAIAKRVIDEAITSADGRLAGEVLGTGGTQERLTPDKKHTLTRLHAAAALEPHSLTAIALAEVHTTIESSIDLIRRRIHESVWDSYPRAAHQAG